MHLNGIFAASVTLHIVSLFCACVGNTITHYRTVDFCISRGLRYAHRDVWGKPILTGKQVHRSLCLNMQLSILILLCILNVIFTHQETGFRLQMCGIDCLYVCSLAEELCVEMKWCCVLHVCQGNCCRDM